jgi:hypothetical protein
MKLKPDDLDLISTALLDAFNRDTFASMLYARLGVRLSDVTSGRGFVAAVQEIVAWAERNDQVEALVRGAKKAVPTNRKLKTLPDTFVDVEQFQHKVSQESQQPATGNTGIQIEGEVSAQNVQIASGDHGEQIAQFGGEMHRYSAETPPAYTPQPPNADEQFQRYAQIDTVFILLFDQIDTYAPAEVQEQAFERLTELKSALQQTPPNSTVSNYVADWFAAHAPLMTLGVKGAIQMVDNM